MKRTYRLAGAPYFARDARVLARDLVGALLVHRTAEGGGAVRVARIVETEAYRGPNDKACHARVGLTQRTRTLLGPPARAYVFLIYGMHHCFNVVCLRDGGGHAVLVRAGEPVEGIEPGTRCDGPGRFARAMGLTRGHDGASLLGGPLSVVPRRGRLDVAVSARVGVAYAGEDADRPWRFFDADSVCVSRPAARLIGRGRP